MAKGLTPKNATSPDFIVVGAGSAGCAVASQLIDLKAGTVALVEAGPSNKSPVVKMPFGLVWMMGSKSRDWCYQSSPQSKLGGRRINIPRGKMLGGSSSINSMVWFRGRQDDFDNWGVEGWSWQDVEPAFEAIEKRTVPQKMATPNPLVKKLQNMFANKDEAPSPECESAGPFRYNMAKGKRNSAADAFLPKGNSNLTILLNREIDLIKFKEGHARSVVFTDGSELQANKGIVLSAGAIASPAILMRSGIGDSKKLKQLGIDVVVDQPQIGANLHDHPGVGLHYRGADNSIASGYGITFKQISTWVAAPFQYIFNGTGRLASPTVEGGVFFNARGENGIPDVQSHFIPFMLGWQGRRYISGAGYFADVCVCRPKSRGKLTINSRDPHQAPEIDLGLFNDARDLETMVSGLRRLRNLLQDTDLGTGKGVEAFPADKAQTEEEIRDYIIERAGTAYHPVGTVRMGEDDAPLTPRLNVRGVDGLWVADASVMPSITSANTNAPCMMIGYRAGEIIAQDIS